MYNQKKMIKWALLAFLACFLIHTVTVRPWSAGVKARDIETVTVHCADCPHSPCVFEETDDREIIKRTAEIVNDAVYLGGAEHMLLGGVSDVYFETKKLSYGITEYKEGREIHVTVRRDRDIQCYIYSEPDKIAEYFELLSAVKADEELYHQGEIELSEDAEVYLAEEPFEGEGGFDREYALCGEDTAQGLKEIFSSCSYYGGGRALENTAAKANIRIDSDGYVYFIDCYTAKNIFAAKYRGEEKLWRVSIQCQSAEDERALRELTNMYK